jgi:hypothetical protein
VGAARPSGCTRGRGRWNDGVDKKSGLDTLKALSEKFDGEDYSSAAGAFHLNQIGQDLTEGTVQ